MSERGAVISLGITYVMVQLGAMLLTLIYPTDMGAFEDAGDPLNAIWYVVLLLGMTGLILLLIRLGGERAIKALFLFSFSVALFYAVFPLIYAAVPVGGFVLVWSLAIVVILDILMVARPVWWVLNTVAFLVAMSVTAILGVSLSVIPVLILMALLLAYDYWAVHRTKHMITLAEAVTELDLPIMFIAPKRSGLRQDEVRSRDMSEGGERAAVMMGVGDAVIPGILVVSSLTFLPADGLLPNANLVVALMALIGGTVGFGLLMRRVMRGAPQAGLPLLNGGAICGFALGWALMYLL